MSAHKRETRRERKARRARFANRSGTAYTKRPCLGCGEMTDSGHFVPPSFGDPGFFACKPGPMAVTTTSEGGVRRSLPLVAPAPVRPVRRVVD